ncbi:type IV pilus modification protein PilV [Agaribacterium sp. ZY112]|uniref:type IV pilus modification protein PilV n=1 Tax=Agaribacterium sp. ZY112 TaxID=3233574 RepID=UPI0035252D09
MLVVRTQKNQTGVALIESLISLFILAIGLLGILAMQATGIKSAQRAEYSSMVPVLASDIVDRIYAYDDVDVTTDDDAFNAINTDSVAAPPTCQTAAAGCTKEDQKKLIVGQWANEVKSNLPMGRADISLAASGLYTVTIMWDNDNLQPTGTACGGDPAVDLACYTLELRL